MHLTLCIGIYIYPSLSLFVPVSVFSPLTGSIASKSLPFFTRNSTPIPLVMLLFCIHFFPFLLLPFLPRPPVPHRLLLPRLHLLRPSPRLLSTGGFCIRVEQKASSDALLRRHAREAVASVGTLIGDYQGNESFGVIAR